MLQIVIKFILFYLLTFLFYANFHQNEYFNIVQWVSLVSQ